MTNCAGVSFRRTLRHYCSSRTSSGMPFAAKTSFTTIEIRPYSSGRKNTLAITGAPISSPMECTCRWSRRHFRTAVRNQGCLRLPRMGGYGGRSFSTCGLMKKPLWTRRGFGPSNEQTSPYRIREGLPTIRQKTGQFTSKACRITGERTEGGEPSLVIRRLTKPTRKPRRGDQRLR